MSKLSKQDKIDIYNNWKNYNISAKIQGLKPIEQYFVKFAF